ncbi:MAG: hypothetical protein R3F35_02245 [Myxococcota bacterium]
MRNETTPLRLDPVFEDAGAVLEGVRSASPYRLQSVVDRTNGGQAYTPWFKAYWAASGNLLRPEAEALFRSPSLLEAAARCFGAEIIRPQALMVNLQAPMPASEVHLDMPHFRGAPARTHAPALLYAMGRSGLFERWRIRIASALIWFHQGIGGAFEYWPDGPERPARVAAPPLWNEGLLADNERMLHCVGQIGPSEAHLPHDLLRDSAQLHAADADGWTIRDRGADLWRYSAEQLRISILWKAHALADAEAANVLDGGRDDLEPERIEAVFARHAREHGFALPTTDDPRTDSKWIRAVEALPPR